MPGPIFREDFLGWGREFGGREVPGRRRDVVITGESWNTCSRQSEKVSAQGYPFAWVGPVVIAECSRS